ncbi:helix-turn-helix transcriptional regulator [Kribbella pratensis]|uniref:Regulatory LuxR family protein n=1 Tax=Kribbella pratensis TaxID=2512112 RepID=A0A4R8CK03_9ACTN|nr:AAA family ATPase [Kribbella pratensis]TDW76161.1 regulatory LuxR family protein [Kribbella pratensis]
MKAVGERLKHRLVGRGPEQHMLGQVLAGAAEGRPAAAVVRGEAGVGKTRLLREVCTNPDFLVLWGSCMHFGGASVPYAPVIGILQEWLATADPAEQTKVLAGAGDLGSLLPGMGGSHGVPAGRLVPVVDLVLNRIADLHRTVVVVDDLHWADLASLDVLAYLITGFRRQRLTVLGTCRDEDLGEGHPLHGWLADMRRMPSFGEIHLERLQPADTGSQLEDLLGQAPDIDLLSQVQARSDGNPYLTELLVQNLSGDEAVLPATVPEGLREALLAAWHQMSEHARQLVRVLAVGGRPTDLDLLAAVASRHGVEPDAMPGCVLEAQERGVLAPGHADPCWFRHPLLAEVLYDGLPAGEGPRIHASFLDVLANGPTESVAADLAVHSQQAGRVDDAYRWSSVAAEHAADLRAPAEQAIQLERMCDLWNQVSPELRGADDRTALHVRASAVCSRVGRNDKAVELLTAALCWIDRAHEPLLAAAVLVDRGNLRWHRTEPVEAVAADIREAVELATRFPDSAEYARALGTLAWAENWQRLPTAIAHAEEAVRLARIAGSDRALATALIGRCSALSLTAPERALADGQEAERLARSCGATLQWLMAVSWQGTALDVLGRRAEATDVLLRGYTDLVVPGRDLFGYFLGCAAAQGLLQAGRWQECEALVRAGLAARCPNITGAGIRLTAAVLAVRSGRTQEARQHLDRALELVAERFPGTRAMMAITGAEVLVAEGKRQEAVDWVRVRLTGSYAVANSEDEELLIVYATAAAELARRARDAGDLETVSRAVASLDDVISSWPCEPFTQKQSVPEAQSMQRAWFEAEVGRCRDVVDQMSRWERAADACAAAGMPWHRAVAQWRCAEAAIAAGRAPIEVGELLREARRTADELGAEALLRSVESLARRARITLREPEPIVVPEETVLSALTPREREILAFLVTGRSNGEIAKELVISDKTVSVHVSSILRKTGTTTRFEAAALAERLGGPGA